MQLTVLEGILILLTSAVMAATLFRRMHLPPILGYLLVGILVGPYGLALISDTEATRELAEYGVVFLMFTIGLEFSLTKLLAMKRLVIGLGGLQVLITTFLALGTAVFFGATLPGAVVIGGVVAMSSTAITIKQLHDQRELNEPHGFNALGVLLFQDVAVIAFLILIPSLSDGGQNILIPLFWALVKAVGVMMLILFLGRWILRPLFREIAVTKSLEIFTLTILLVTLSAAWLTETMGLSLALGAFAAGMMLGETEYRHQIEVEIRPFRDVLLGLFFITIGMLLNVTQLPEIWLGVLLLLFGIIIGKTLLITGLSLIFGSDHVTAFRTGLILAQGGEFGFALLALASSSTLISQQYSQIALAALIFSMALAPFLIRFNKNIAEKIFQESAKITAKEVIENVTAASHQLSKHIIICGYGRVGQNIARFLETEGFEFIALDMEPLRVEEAQSAGDNVQYGDSRNLNILLSAGLIRARALIISFSDLPSSYKILHQVRKNFPDLPILIRTNDDRPLKSLQEAGATEVIPETLEASLMLAFHALVLLGVPAARALRATRKVRQGRYELLHRVFPSHDIEDMEIQEQELEQLSVVNLPPGAASCGKKLAELALENLAVKITAICRDGIKRPDPNIETALKEGDVLVLYGTLINMEKAERLILEGTKISS